MKVTTEKLPKSLLALDIELDRNEVEKGLDRAARRISQNTNIPGFRRGKAPRFIVENYYGRPALAEEASKDLIDRSFREALKQESISPVGPSSVEDYNFLEAPYTMRVLVPVAPTVVLPDYKTIQAELAVAEVSDEMVDAAMRERLDRHVVLRDLEEPRPAQAGDQLTALIESFVNGEALEEREEGEPLRETELILENERLASGLSDGLIGIELEETREVTVRMPSEHQNEKVRDQDVLFRVTAKKIRERLVPDWEELPTLEEVEGTLDELRETTRKELETAARQTAENNAVNSYLSQVVAQTEFDIPDVLFAQEAEEMLEEQGREFQRYGITLDQMLQYRGQTREHAIEELIPTAEPRLKQSLVLRELVRAEELTVDSSDILAEIERVVATYKEEERDRARSVLTGSELQVSIANSVLNTKLRERLLVLATGQATASAEEPAAEVTSDSAVSE